MAQRTLNYKGYQGSIEVNNSDFTLLGKILYVNEDCPYAGESFEQLEENFRKTVDDHIASYLAQGFDPPFSEEDE